ncbi:hypothetical protein LUZ60_003008 [Juncus effusus]|nr:hypothetical protein LUZ60_003008 [Juncus effusus]
MAKTTLLYPILPSLAPNIRLLCRPSVSFASNSALPIKSARFRTVELRQKSCSAGRLNVRCGAAKFIVQSDFGREVLESDVPVLVDFVAGWCGPCKLIAPTIDWASKEYEGRIKVVKIDHDENPQVIEEYKVYGLPTLILFKDGKEVPESRREGAITKAKLKEYLDSLLDSLSVA